MHEGYTQKDDLSSPALSAPAILNLAGVVPAVRAHSSKTSEISKISEVSRGAPCGRPISRPSGHAPAIIPAVGATHAAPQRCASRFREIRAIRGRSPTLYPRAESMDPRLRGGDVRAAGVTTTKQPEIVQAHQPRPVLTIPPERCTLDRAGHPAQILGKGTPTWT